PRPTARPSSSACSITRSSPSTSRNTPPTHRSTSSTTRSTSRPRGARWSAQSGCPAARGTRARLSGELAPKALAFGLLLHGVEVLLMERHLVGQRREHDQVRKVDCHERRGGSRLGGRLELHHQALLAP